MTNTGMEIIAASDGSNVGVGVDVTMVIMVGVVSNAVGEAEKLSIAAAVKRNRRIWLSCIPICLHVYTIYSYRVT